MNSAVRPFLMKVLLKKKVYESREQCIGPTGKANNHKNAQLKKKERKKETQTQ